MPPCQVMLNDSLKRHVLGLEPGERRRLREKFAFLENGVWNAGVRVKKLKGVARRVVLEARISRGERLLFTLGSLGGRTAIFVWALVAHDDVTAAARRISPAEAPFLDFASETEEDLPALAIDAVPRAWLSQEDVDEKVPADYGPQRWLVLDDAEWERILRSPSGDPFELHLHLTREQAAILELDPPVLLSGTAGSGKTTLSVYYLLRQPAGRRRLFLTFNEGLRSLCEGIYRGLAAGREESGPAPTFALFRGLVEELVRPVAARFPPDREVGLREFASLFRDHPDHRRWDPELVWEEIRSIIKGAKLPLNPGRLEALATGCVSGTLRPRERAELVESLAGLGELAVAAVIDRALADRTPHGPLRGLIAAIEAPGTVDERSLAPALEAVVEAVRTADADVSRPLLSLEEYLALGRKRAPTFRWDRPALHAIARWYQDRLESSGSWDELDLCRAALQRLAAGPEAPGWDLVVCDEAQDFTDLQLSLVFRLARDPRRVVVTADPRQIVNPSGFRWEEVKSRFFERGLPVPEVRRLNLNFRCVGSIVRLANGLLELKQNLVGVSDTETREQWKFPGRPPVLLGGMGENEVLEGVSARAAGQAVLVREADERDVLKRRLGTELVFTIREAKGLEFDGVLLWKFASAGEAAGLWRRIRRAEIDTAEHAAKVRHELALLYVAVTRARNTLLIYDGDEPSEVWDVDAITGLVARSSEVARLAGLWRSASSPAEWERQGDYLFERGHHAAALECFRNAGEEDKAALTEAHLAAAQGRHAEAAPLFERRGMDALAAASWEKAAAWDRAAAAWTRAGEADRADVCSIRSQEAHGRWRDAARAWKRRSEIDAAVADWEKAGDFAEAAEHWLARGDAGRALPYFDRAKKPLRAAACLLALGRPLEAADRYFKAGDYAAAAPLYREAGNEGRWEACLRKLGDWKPLAELHEARGEAAEAVADLKRWFAGNGERRRQLEAEAEAWVEESAHPDGVAHLDGAAHPAETGRTGGAAPLHAAILRAALGDEAESLALSGRYEEAAGAVEGSDLPPTEREQRAGEYLAKHLESAEGRSLHSREALHDAADRLLAEGKPREALARYRALGDADGECSAYLRLDRDEEAITHFLETGAVAEARRLMRSRALRLSAGFLREFVEMVTEGDLLASDSGRDFAGFAADLLENALPGLGHPEAAALEERFLRAVEGRLTGAPSAPAEAPKKKGRKPRKR
jgi:tetratricopeptide (TPR) repeat protein